MLLKPKFIYVDKILFKPPVAQWDCNISKVTPLSREIPAVTFSQGQGFRGGVKFNLLGKKTFSRKLVKYTMISDYMFIWNSHHEKQTIMDYKHSIFNGIWLDG